jgi:alpha/beta superfamily hydrolase
VQTLKIMKENQERIAALIFLPDSFDYLLITCHGFRGRKENSDRICAFAREINELGMGLLAFDFTGSGESDGDFSDITLTRQVQDLNTVIDYAYRKYQKPLILLGRSFGGSTVLAGGAEESRVKGFILWSTPVELQQTFTRVMEEAYEELIKGRTVKIVDESGYYHIKPSFIEDIFRHNMDDYLKKVHNRPVLIVQGQEDNVVAVYNARYMYNRLCNAEMVIVDDADHRFENKIRDRELITIKWLKKHFVNE